MSEPHADEPTPTELAAPPDDEGAPEDRAALSPGALALGAVVGFAVALVWPRSWR